MIRTLTAVVFAVLIATSAQAQEYKVGPLVIDQPWTRATPKSATVAGGYLKITNTGSTPDRLTGGSADVARKFEVHQMSMDGGVMKMNAVDKVPLPAGKPVELKPGGYHVMLMDLTRPLKEGDIVPITLTVVDKAGKTQKIEVRASVRALTATSPH